MLIGVVAAVVLIAPLFEAARIQIPVGDKCCCKADNAWLTCKVFDNPRFRKRCPRRQNWFEYSEYFDASAPDGCSVRYALGPPAQSCKGETEGCKCAKTIDAFAPSNGLLKGRMLSSKQYNVAGFFNVQYGDFPIPSEGHLKGRWEVPTFPSFDSSGIASDHCSKHFLETLRLEKGKPSRQCFQFVPVLGPVGSEQCLTVDIFTPAVIHQVGVEKTSAASRYRIMTEDSLPVMVFLNGGAFVMGDKNQNGIYDGRNLAQRDVIVVTVNYRVGVFGFLHHPALKKDNKPLMNLGLQDQLEALKWIKGNIEAFGGNSRRVTLFGESAGAMSICAHLASPTSREYFHNAILQSGNCDSLFIWQPEKYAKDFGKRYLRGVFGRIRGCGLRDLEDVQTYKKRQNDCSVTDTAPLNHVAALCSDLFLDGSDLHLDVSLESFAAWLPFEGKNGCSQDYSGCLTSTLPSGLDLDAALLECATRLEPQYVWVNQFGLIHREKRPAGFVEKEFGIDFTGLPKPPHLPWSPVVDVDLNLPVHLDFARQYGRMHLPIRVFRDPIWRPRGPRLVTAGFNRDEGSLFSLLLPAFFPELDLANGISDEAYDNLLREVVCQDWAPAHQISAGPSNEECENRVSKVKEAYDAEGEMSSLRGSCCSKDPGLLRIQRMMTDYLFACPTIRMLESLDDPSRHLTTRIYNFASDDVLPRRPINLKKLLGAFHFSELFFVFGDQRPGGNLPMGGSQLGFGLSWSRAAAELADEMQDDWADLGKNMHPGDWPALNKAGNMLNGPVRLFSTATNSTTAPVDFVQLKRAHHCTVLDALEKRVLHDAIFKT